MIDTVDSPSMAEPVADRGRRRWPWVVAAVVAVVLLAGAITAVRLVNRYREADALVCACGLAWDPTDAKNFHSIEIGSVSASIVAPRPGEQQSFYFLVTNRSDVTQTILGGAGDYLSSQPEHVAVAAPTGQELLDENGPEHHRFVTTPQTLDPGRSRWVRNTIDTYGTPGKVGIWNSGRQEWWDGLDLRVRVGAFTRTEHVDFGRSEFVLTNMCNHGCPS